MGIEPMTSFLPRMRSATELRRRREIIAGFKKTPKSDLGDELSHDMSFSFRGITRSGKNVIAELVILEKEWQKSPHFF